MISLMRRLLGIPEPPSSPPITSQDLHEAHDKLSRAASELKTVVDNTFAALVRKSIESERSRRAVSKKRSR